MNKTKSKVLSLILASAMIVSSFSSLNFASAATRTETGIVTISGDDEIYLVSDPDKASKYIDIEDFIGTGTVETYDKESTSGAEVVKITHVSGDKLLKFDDETISVKSDVSGKEVINVRWEADGERDDKDVTVKADKDITIYTNVIDELFLGEAGASSLTGTGAEKPGDVKTAAVNEQYLNIGVYNAIQADSTKTVYATDATADNLLANYEEADLNTLGYFSAGSAVEGMISLEKDKIFKKDSIAVDATTSNIIKLKTSFVGDADKDDVDLADTGKAVLKIKLGDKNDLANEKKKDVTVSVDKKWNADIDLTTGEKAATTQAWEINKRSGKTYIAPKSTNLDWDDKDDWNEHKDDNNINVVGSYDTIVADKEISVLGGSVGNLESKASISVEGGTTGTLKAPIVEVEGGTTGLIKDKATTVNISGGKVSEIAAKDSDSTPSTVTITGGEITGNVFGNKVSIDADDDDINTVIGGKVTADSDDADALTIDASSDATVTIKGAVTSKGESTILISGENVTLNTVDGDYSNDISFEDFTGTIKSLVNTNDDVNLSEESVVVLTSGVLTANTVDVEEDSKITVAQANVESISGEGTFAFPAGKLFVEDGIDSDTILVITDGLVVGATAFTSYEDAVDGSDLNTLGYTLETKSASSTTEKHVIKSIQFAGVQFDKTDLTIAKGYSDTLTVANYPTGTALPAGYSIEWDVDVNDDYITVTTEGNVATVKAVDYSTDRAVDNQGKITATVVDADGYEVEELLTASINVTAVAVPASVVTLDTTKPVTVGTNAVYQYIAKSSTGAVMSAASSDTQIATVELFNAADPRGYKFQVKGVAEGTATITTTDANGATATLTVNVVKVNGTLKADTTTYTFAPGKVYDVKFSTTGTTAVPVVTVNGKVVSIAPRGNGVYRVTAQNPGTAFVVATVGNTHVSVKFVVANGAASVGVKGNNVSTLK